MSEIKIKKMSPFMGSKITHANKREFEKKQAEYFIDRYNADRERQRQEILEKKDKTIEETNEALSIFDQYAFSEKRLKYLSEEFARQQRNKESKHYNAWLKNQSYYKYKGQIHAVMTEDFINSTKDIKEIQKVEESESVQ